MRRSFPWIALAVGLIFSLVLLWNASASPAGNHPLPLLTALLMSEFGCLLTAIAVVFSVRNLSLRGIHTADSLLLLANLVLAVNLLLSGLRLWSGLTAG